MQAVELTLTEISLLQAITKLAEMVDLLPTQLQLLNKEVVDINLPPINQELEPTKVAHQEHLEQQVMEQPLTHHRV